ncbi:hypothetical protein C8F04DRAFT_1390526 [Mycena alexandri]|uniref:Uncharacterized protein n=1 Tax=Mycena alexandri TaxID=1745969 RepID=A0AAD6TAJ0_9AGAR|nr:hypothetical protein C8F04DRAFT_1390526 [Mycena alexandri]
MSFVRGIHRAISRAWSPRWSSSFVRNPPSSAPREVPTPLLFVSAKDWDVDSTRGIDAIATTLSMQGFTCIQCDISRPTTDPPLDSDKFMDHLAADLKSQIRLSFLTAAFPPVIFARSSATLIAQAYISSNPVSAMMLMGNIPSTNADVPKSLLPTPLAEFNFEPKFPIALLTSPREMERLSKTNRLAQDPQVELLTTEDLESQDAFLKIEDWLDDLGI